MESTSPESVSREKASVHGAAPLIRHEASHQSMGTIFSLIAYGPSSACLEELACQAFAEIDRLNNQMSHYKAESELSAINHQAWRQSMVVTPELFRLLEDSARYSEETNGAFDITIGPLMKSWGFFRGWGRLPSPLELAQVRKRIGYRHVKLDSAARTVEFDDPGIELDLGAIAKGYAVDRVVEILRAEGVTRALISAGTSSIYALGAPPGKQGWAIAMRHPLDSRKTACLFRLQNLSISVSGDCENFFELGGRIYAHIMDPSSGMPAEDMLMTVVISSSTTESDALSTSFFVGGVEKSRAYLEHHPDLIAIFFIPTRSTHTVEEVVLKSSVTKIPADCFARM